MAYDDWRVKNPKISQLRLDPRNPRIPDVGVELSQSQLIADLVENDDVEKLAKSIAEEGWRPTELLLAIESNNHFVVCEGNRRTAALKCLANPQAAPENKRRAFARLAANPGANLPDRVQTVIAPSHEEADVLVRSRHTTDQVARWKPAMQAKFYRDRIEQDGYTIEELSSRFNVSVSAIHDFLRNDRLYRLACVAAQDLPEDVAARVLNPREFPLTTLERVADAAAGREFLQVETDDDTYKTSVKRGEFMKAFRAVVQHVATKALDSRTANSNTSLAEYLNKHLEADRADPSESGAVRIDTIIKQAEKNKEPQPPPSEETPEPRQRRRSTPKSIVTPDVRCTVDKPRVREVFDELKTLQLKNNKQPNATALMLRTLLELSLKHHLEKKRRWKELVAKHKPRNPPPGWYPGLKHSIQFFIDDEDLSKELHPDAIAPLRNFLNERHSPSIKLLNLYVHNLTESPNEGLLRTAWEMLKPMLQVVLARVE